MIENTCLVGGLNPAEKYHQLGLLFPTIGEIKAMFQTNQVLMMLSKTLVCYVDLLWVDGTGQTCRL